MPSPKIIACGHYHISTKAGNSFPAVLVLFPDEKNPTRERYFWRSKRDFLLLSRAISGPHSFPKKAFAKLSDQALTGGPWVCPDDDAVDIVKLYVAYQNNTHLMQMMRKTIILKAISTQT